MEPDVGSDGAVCVLVLCTGTPVSGAPPRGACNGGRSVCSVTEIPPRGAWEEETAEWAAPKGTPEDEAAGSPTTGTQDCVEAVLAAESTAGGQLSGAVEAPPSRGYTNGGSRDGATITAAELRSGGWFASAGSGTRELSSEADTTGA